MGPDCCRGNRYGGAARPDVDYDFNRADSHEDRPLWKKILWLVVAVAIVILIVVL